ncbi:ABC transporter permease [uncultured Microscilla sp.]|uniref:ABC transporter permease n=1 Tax=uncultured Microscilla sp. TaxID=432653 RepID=UPI00261511D6|nr:ABC transporter permease subunit [uncultured Microscilla sp.]
MATSQTKETALNQSANWWRIVRVLLAMCLTGVILLPFLLLLGLSLSRQWIYPNLLPQQVGLMNWAQLWGYQQNLLQSLGVSLVLSLSVAFIATWAGFFTGRMLAYHPYGRQLLKLAYLPYVISPVIYAACLKVYFIWFGLDARFWGVLFAQLIITYPFSVILFSEYWSYRTQALEQLVATLGGSPWQTVWKVLVPISQNILLVSFFQTFLISWFEYGLTQLIGLGKVPTLTLMVFGYLKEANIYFAALASCLLVMPPLLLLWVNKKYVLKGRGSD